MRGGRTFVGVALVLSSACSVPVATGLDETEANRVVSALLRGGFAAEKVPDPADGRFRVEVGDGDSSAAVALLSDEGLPKAERPGLLQALDDGALVPSRASEHARVFAGTAGELERTLSNLSGVVSARVHLAVPETNRLAPEAPEQLATASVLLRHRGRAPALSEADVRRLVAAAVPGLSPDHVTIVTSEVKAPPPSPDLVRFGPITTTRGSAPLLKWAIASVAIVNIVLVGAIFTLLRRARKTRERAKVERS